MQCHTGTACGECPAGEDEGLPGQCMPVGNCTRLGSYWPDAERGCVRAGLVGANAQCSSTCRANSADNGWGVCVCNPGYVYTVPTAALSGPTNCVERTDELCGTASDPGTCGPGGTWNSGTASCDCGDGYERSGDGLSCVEQTQYRAGICPRNLGGLPVSIGILRHDDVQSYSQVGGGRSNERTSGFYTTSLVRAIAAALLFLSEQRVVYVDGEHQHTSTTDGSDCDLPVVQRATFDNIRSRSDSVVWTEYHLLLKNCQHWAKVVVPQP